MAEKSEFYVRFAIARSLIVFGVLGIIASSILLIAGPSGSYPLPSSIEISSEPSTRKITDQEIADYTVAPDLPRYIEIPAIHVPRTRVITLDLLPNNQIATPDNTNDAGWYSGSTKPGQDGAMFILGHVSSRNNNGIFHNLKKLQTGDKIIITRGDGIIYTFAVVSSKYYPFNHVDMGTVLSPVQTGKVGLNLMTCDGGPVPGTNTFDHRLVVFASQV